MGLFSFFRGKPAAKPKTAKPAASAQPGGASREELIRKALQIREEKKREFDKLDPAVREKLLRQAMGKKDPDDGTKA